MKHKYVSLFTTKFAIALLVLLFGSFQTAKACHGVAIVGLNSVVSATDITITGSSDGATCGCGPYYMEAEISCNPAALTGNAPIWSAVGVWNQPAGQWWHSLLNVPNYNAASGWPDNCVLEPYLPLVIPFSGLCPGTTYYWHIREHPATGSAGPWSVTASFTTPGLPPTSILSSTASQHTVCPGATVQLNATVSGGCPGATFTYSWAPATGLSNPNIANPTATITSAITYTVTVTGGCFTITSNDDTVGIFMGPPPIAGNVSAAPTTLCSGQSSQVVLLGSNATIYQWQVSNNNTTWVNVPGGTNDTLNTGPMSTTLYFQAIVTGTGWPGTGCGTSVSNSTVVTVQPNPVANAGNNITVCSGGCDTLVGTGGVSYLWMPGNVTTAQNIVCPAGPTTYTLTVTDALGCTGTDQVTVGISNPSVTASPDVSICNSGSTVLFASSQQGSTFSWAPAGSLTGASTANPTATPTVTTTYTVTATNILGCTSMDSVTVTVTNAPPITASSDTSMCAGGVATLTVTGANTYNWQPGNQSTSTISVNPLVTTTYVVTGTTNNCISHDTVVVNVDPIPQVFAGPDYAICRGNQGTLNATGGGSYAWLPTSSIIGNPNQGTVVIQPTVTTTYTVTVTSPSGCISQDVITITVNNPPTVSASATNNPICLGGTTTLSSSGAVAYAWIPNVNLGNPNQVSTSANPSNTTTYQVIGTDVNGCTDTASITITVIPPPAAYYTSTPNECGDTTGVITVNSVVGAGGPYTYQINNVTVVPDANGNFPPMVNGNYNMTVTDQYGCSFNQVAGIGLVNSATVSAFANPTFGTAPMPTTFTATGSSGVNIYNWTFGDSLNTTGFGPTTSFTYTSPGVYTIVVVAYNDLPGCAVYDTLQVEVVDQPQFVVPNVFTPNADGKNDTYMLTILGVKDVSVEIFDRWGRSISTGTFENLTPSKNDLTIWDGTSKSGQVADGVYYYVINATGYDGKPYPFQGFVTVSTGK